MGSGRGASSRKGARGGVTRSASTCKRRGKTAVVQELVTCEQSDHFKRAKINNRSRQSTGELHESHTENDINSKTAVVQEIVTCEQSDHFKRAKINDQSQQSIGELHKSHTENAHNGENLNKEASGTFEAPVLSMGLLVCKNCECVSELPKAKVVDAQLQTKLRLQLFPLDEDTRRGLEKDRHNPYLELTLSARKKISSVIKHLSCKWGSSSVASGELMLFPYDIHGEILLSYPRWTFRDTEVNATEVYKLIGNPPNFRLRYGWFSDLDKGIFQAPVTSLDGKGCSQSDICEGPHKVEAIDGGIQRNQEHKIANMIDSSNKSETEPMKTMHETEIVESRKIENTLPLADWFDCISNISMGSLLAERCSRDADPTCDPAAVKHDLCPPQISHSYDSFDAAIAAHLNRHHAVDPSYPITHTSLLDAEETCQAFPNHSKEASEAPNSAGAFSAEAIAVHACSDLPTSLGSFDFSLFSSSRQLANADSLGISALLASSLDAFQNCSLFSKDEAMPSA